MALQNTKPSSPYFLYILIAMVYYSFQLDDVHHGPDYLPKDGKAKQDQCIQEEWQCINMNGQQGSQI